MKVLVACEESQRVMIEFRNRGHIAFSCDLKECSGGFPQYHIKGDCKSVIESSSWDLIIAHPPCTYLSNAGVCRFYKDGVLDNQRYEKMLVAREFFMWFYNLEGVKLCIENPKPHSMACLPAYTQTIQPFEFGDDYTKLTLLWLKNLPPLIPLCYGYSKKSLPGIPAWTDCFRSAALRSKTFPGIAKAMAQQWS